MDSCDIFNTLGQRNFTVKRFSCKLKRTSEWLLVRVKNGNNNWRLLLLSDACCFVLTVLIIIVIIVPLLQPMSSYRLLAENGSVKLVSEPLHVYLRCLLFCTNVLWLVDSTVACLCYAYVRDCMQCLYSVTIFSDTGRSGKPEPAQKPSSWSENKHQAMQWFVHKLCFVLCFLWCVCMF